VSCSSDPEIRAGWRAIDLAGIGIEVWLPTAENWTAAIHVAGGGGWAGGNHTRVDLLAGAGGAGGTTPSLLSLRQSKAPFSQHRHGHSGPGRRIVCDEPGWKHQHGALNDFAQRGMPEMGDEVETDHEGLLRQAAKYSYWDGLLTGGRQGHKLAQLHPTILTASSLGAPAFNWTRFITTSCTRRSCTCGT